MNLQKQFTRLEINLETLETIWIQHSGFLERITQQSGIKFYYFKNIIILEGNTNQCKNAAQRIYQIIQEDFIIQIEEFHNDEEIYPFYQLFQQPEYRELCQNNQGFWIYSKQSLKKQCQNMQQQGYQPSFPELPQHFLITWFPRINMLFIQEWIFRIIGYQYNQQSLKEKFKFHKQFNITVLEAISIYLILDVQDIMNNFQLIIELNQIQNQCFLVIKANNMESFEEAFMILENHLINQRFWAIAQLEMKLSSNDLLFLEKTIDDQVRTTSGIKIYSSEEVLIESLRLDKQFDINLNQILNQRYYSDQIFVYADQDKQGEITDKIIQIVRKPKQNVRTDQKQFYYKESQNKRVKNNTQIKQQKQFPFIDYTRKSGKDQFRFYDQKQFQLQSNSFQQYPKKTFINETLNETIKNDDSNIQQDRPLKNYIKIQHNSRLPKSMKQKKKKWESKYNNKNKHVQQVEDIVSNDASVSIPQNFQISYDYQYSQYQEEEKSSQLLYVEELNKLIKCQVIKIELFQYQLLYTQCNLQSNQKINFTEFKQSFKEFQNLYYDLQHEILLEFDTDSIKMNIKCKQQDDINQIKFIFHKYFLQKMYFVTQYSIQVQNLIDFFIQKCKVEYFLTKTELSGFVSEQQIAQLEKIEDGQQVAIKISNYSYRHHQLFIGKFNDFKIQQTSNQNSSIQDISRQIVNNMKVIIISEDQLKYLLQEFPELEACQLRKFEEYFKTAFYFVQIEDIEELLEKAKVEFKRMNEKYVKNYVQMKKQKNQKNWMKKIKEVKNYNQEVFKLYCYNIMETFNTELLNDINDIQMNIEEYQSNQNLSLYQEAIIELGHRELNPNDPDSIENLLFESDFKFEPKITKLTDLPNGTFITLWIRNQKDNLSLRQTIQKNKILPRGYFQKK